MSLVALLGELPAERFPNGDEFAVDEHIREFERQADGVRHTRYRSGFVGGEHLRLVLQVDVNMRLGRVAGIATAPDYLPGGYYVALLDLDAARLHMGDEQVFLLRDLNHDMITRRVRGV